MGKRIPVSEETHRFLKLKKLESGAGSFDELLRDVSREAFGENPGDEAGGGGRPRLEDTLDDALFGDEDESDDRGIMEI